MLGLLLLRSLTATVLRLASRVAAEALFLHELNRLLGRAAAGTAVHRRSALRAAEEALLRGVRASVETRTVRLPCGVSIHTIIARPLPASSNSSRDDHPIVLLHGHSMAGATFWRNLDDLLAQGYTSVYAPDLPGFGQSSRPRFRGDGRPEAGVAFFLRPLAQWVTALRLGTFTLLGHSLGSYIAHEYAAVHGARVRRLVLVAPAAVTRRTKLAVALWFRFTPQRLLTHGGLIATALFHSAFPAAPPYNAPGFRALTFCANSISTYRSGDAAAAAVLVVHRRAALSWDSQCVRPLAERPVSLACPVLIIGGAFDCFVDADALTRLRDAMIARGNSVSVAVLPAADHSPHIVDPAGFAKVLSRARGVPCPKTEHCIPGIPVQC